jgi:cobalt-zinc-cadmium efflux system protein
MGYVTMQGALALSIGLNLAFVLFEVVAANSSGSLALYSDAAHNMGDLVSLIFAWGATLLARRRPSTRFTYGLRGSTILAALANGILLLCASLAIAYASIDRLMHPAPVAGGVVALVALLGVFTNGVSAIFLARHRHDDLNARGAFLHLATDAATSVAVIVAGLLVRATGIAIIDTAMSLALAVLIFVSTLKLLAESLRLVLQGVPDSIDCDSVQKFLLNQPGVAAAHDLHIWAMSTAENAMTAHLVMPGGHPGDQFIANLARQLDERFKLGHVTLQVEIESGCGACYLGLNVA